MFLLGYLTLPPSDPVSIYFSHISKTFTSGLFRRKHVNALDDVSLRIDEGDIFGIIGPNGAGKSTLIKLLMGFIRLDSGSITIHGKDANDPNARTQIGYLPESAYYYDHLTVLELMAFSAITSGISKNVISKRSSTLLNTMGLENAKNRKLRSYSKGMTQRAGFCFALIHAPNILILDEPMSGLDPLGRKMIVDIILDLKKQGKTILLCSHILNDVERLCDHIVIMHQGKLLETATRQDIHSKHGAHGLEEYFLQVIQGTQHEKY